MDLNVKVGDFRSEAVDAIVIGAFEDEESGRNGIFQMADDALSGALGRLLNLGDFEGKHKQASILYTSGAIAAPRLALVGLGKSDEFNIQKAREAAGEITCQLRDLGVKTMAILTPSEAPPDMIQAATEGSLLAAYQFNQHKTEELDEVKELDAVTFLVSDEEGKSALEGSVALGNAIARGNNACARFEQSTGQ